MRKNILRGPRNVFAALCVVVAILGTPVLLFAHARLLRSSPAANSTVATAPTELSLWYSEAPEIKFTSIQLADSAGNAIAVGPVASIPEMGVRVPITGPLPAGKYTVSWKTAASDGHASSGKFSFTVAGSAASTSAAQAPPAASAPAPAAGITVQIDSSHMRPKSNAAIEPSNDATFSTAMRWAELVALLTIIGIVTFRLAVIPAAKWEPDLVADTNDRLVRLARAVLVLFAVATLTRGFAQSELLANGGTRMHALMTMVQETRWGSAWGIGIAGVVIVLVGFVIASRAMGGWLTAAIGLIAIALSEALTGHSGAVRHFSAAIAADVAHLLGAGGWLGGLTAMVLCAMPALKRLEPARSAKAGTQLLQAYHGAATECVTIVVASAVIAMWTRFPTVSAIWTTPYGQMLLRKTIFVAIVLAFGLYHWKKIVQPGWNDDTRFRFQRSAIGELVFGAVVVAFTALLITMPLPH